MRNVLTCVLFLLTITAFGCSEQKTENIGKFHPDNDSIDNKLLQKWCSECHAPPNANGHTQTEWPNIVLRMQNHRIQKGLVRIPGNEIDEIISYLQNNQAAQ